MLKQTASNDKMGQPSSYTVKPYLEEQIKIQKIINLNMYDFITLLSTYKDEYNKINILTLFSNTLYIDNLSLDMKVKEYFSVIKKNVLYETDVNNLKSIDKLFKNLVNIDYSINFFGFDINDKYTKVF